MVVFTVYIDLENSLERSNDAFSSFISLDFGRDQSNQVTVCLLKTAQKNPLPKKYIYQRTRLKNKASLRVESLCQRLVQCEVLLVAGISTGYAVSPLNQQGVTRCLTPFKPANSVFQLILHQQGAMFYLKFSVDHFRVKRSLKIKNYRTRTSLPHFLK